MDSVSGTRHPHNAPHWLTIISGTAVLVTGVVAVAEPEALVPARYPQLKPLATAAAIDAYRATYGSFGFEAAVMAPVAVSPETDVSVKSIPMPRSRRC